MLQPIYLMLYYQSVNDWKSWLSPWTMWKGVNVPCNALPWRLEQRLYKNQSSEHLPNHSRCVWHRVLPLSCAVFCFSHTSDLTSPEMPKSRKKFSFLQKVTSVVLSVKFNPSRSPPLLDCAYCFHGTGSSGATSALPYLDAHMPSFVPK